MTKMKGTCRILAIGSIVALVLLGHSGQLRAADGFLRVEDGYFYDSLRGEYFIPRGVAYQTWNKPVGANQSLDQIAYDFREFKKLGANSVRAELVWSELEVRPDFYDWEKADALIALAENLGLRLFLVIGYQYPPTDWFPTDWFAMNDERTRSDVLNYNHPEAQAAYQDHIRAVIDRYKDRTAIGGWILGNEFAFFDLWEDPYRYLVRRFLGYDAISQQSFRDWLAEIYQNDINALNANWSNAKWPRSYRSFSEAEMPDYYPEERDDPAYHDLVQWRMKSIGDFIALAAVAAKSVDPNHLITYSMVGGIFNGRDANHTAEDDQAIVQACIDAGAPLDFWSINNYAWALMGSEMRSADFGVSKYQEQTGLPVMISETGHSSTENLFEGAGPRQGKAIVSQVWEALMAGSVGVHIFHWNDRNLYNEDFFLRERGFGFADEVRLPKDENESYAHISDMFRQMGNLNIDHLFGGSRSPEPNVQFFWSTNSLMVWPSANQENAMLWGALKRSGYQPAIINDKHFAAGAYTNAPILLLSRARQLTPVQLDTLATNVLESGTHIHADADLPGKYDAYVRENPGWEAWIQQVFGIDASAADAPWDKWARTEAYGNLTLNGVADIGPFHPGYSVDLASWKIWHGVANVSAEVILQHQGLNNSQAPMPAVAVKAHPDAYAALSTYAMADTFGPEDKPEDRWQTRYDILRTLYQTKFGVEPVLQLTGQGSVYVTSDYRSCANDTVLISLLNESTNSAQVTVTCPTLLAGHTVENLLSGAIVEHNSDGVLPPLTLQGDDYVLLYVYDQGDPGAGSMIHPTPARVWFENAPQAVWPYEGTYRVSVAHDLPGGTTGSVRVRLCRSAFSEPDYGAATSENLADAGTTELDIPVLDADRLDTGYVSSLSGTDYVWRAELLVGESVVSSVEKPVQLFWGIRPKADEPWPSDPEPGNRYWASLEWEDLPSYLPGEKGTPLERVDQWATLQAYDEWYTVGLELRNPEGVVAASHLPTSDGTSSGTLTIDVPADAIGPFHWRAFVQPAPDTFSRNFFDSFEERPLGAQYHPSFFEPWLSYVYPDSGTARRLQHGISRSHVADGKQSAYVIATSSTTAESSSFGIARDFESPIILPASETGLAAYTAAFSFGQTNHSEYTLEMRLEDTDGRYIKYSADSDPDSSGWQTVSATLDQFDPPAGQPDMDRNQVARLTLDVQMLETGKEYQGFFDNVVFDLTGLADGFETNNFGQLTDPVRVEPLAHPWGSFTWPNNGPELWQNEGVHLNASHGSKSAFLVVHNSVGPGTAGFGFEWNFNEVWGLPADTSRWGDYRLTFDFMNKHPDAELPYSATVYAQVKSVLVDGKPGVLQSIPVHYTPDPDRPKGHWVTVGGPLNEFIPIAPDALTFSEFNPNSVISLAIGVTMDETQVQYVASFDNVRFEGPTSIPHVLPPLSLIESFEDRPLGHDKKLAEPWIFYEYSENTNVPGLSYGIHDVASDGRRSAFTQIANPVNAGSFSGFGITYTFPGPWSLPQDTNLWSNYTFAYDFQEPNGHSATLQFQIVDVHGNWMEVGRTFSPGPGGWDTLAGDFSELMLPSYLPAFDTNQVARASLNIVMEQSNVMYAGSFDNIRLMGPVPVPLGGDIVASYASTNDGRDTDADGLYESAETGTGVFRDPSNTGTWPQIPDSDGDGMLDGHEVIAGTNPNEESEFLALQVDVTFDPTGRALLSWDGKAGRVYSVLSLDGDPSTEEFAAVPGLETIPISLDGMVTIPDSRELTTAPRFYLITVTWPESP